MSEETVVTPSVTDNGNVDPSVIAPGEIENDDLEPEVPSEVKPEPSSTDSDEPEDNRDQEILELRQTVRTQKKDYVSLQTQLDKVNQILSTANLVDEETLANQEETKNIFTARQDVLDNLLEVMKVNPEYKDVEEVVSQSNFDDVIEIMAKAYIEKHGGNLGEVIPLVETEVWNRKNPYSFMYKEIKNNHPSYKKGPATAPIIPPGSLANIPGGDDKNSAGWTAKKIDELSEEELSKVPSEVYTRYMQGQLK